MQYYLAIILFATVTFLDARPQMGPQPYGGGAYGGNNYPPYQYGGSGGSNYFPYGGNSYSPYGATNYSPYQYGGQSQPYYEGGYPRYNGNNPNQNGGPTNTGTQSSGSGFWNTLKNDAADVAHMLGFPDQIRVSLDIPT